MEHSIHEMDYIMMLYFAYELKVITVAMSNLRVSGLSLKKRGFTLIELLVVIAIIGLLAAVVIASSTTSKQKGRDARRLQDLKNIATTIMMLQDTNIQFSGCQGTNANNHYVKTCTNPNLSAFQDPSGVDAVCKTDGSVAPCQYTIGQKDISTTFPTNSIWEVCAHLETNMPPGDANQMVSITQDGTIVSGCK